MKAVHQHNDLLLEIEYDPEEPVTINSVHVLDEHYRATGPNLVHFLDKCYLQIAEDEASKFLSIVAEEL